MNNTKVLADYINNYYTYSLLAKSNQFEELAKRLRLVFIFYDKLNESLMAKGSIDTKISDCMCLKNNIGSIKIKNEFTDHWIIETNAQHETFNILQYENKITSIYCQGVIIAMNDFI